MQVVENGRVQPVTGLTALQPGLQVIVAYNLDPLLARRNQTTSLFQQINGALLTWAKKQPASTADDFTLIGNEGVQTIRQVDPQRWASALEDYQPDLLHSKPGLASLSQALDMATDPNPKPNMKRALLYITALPAENQLTALSGLADRAAKLGLRIFVWAVLPANPAVKSVEALQRMAEESDGGLFAYTGTETFPDPDRLLDPLRHLYRVQYQSAAQKSGLQSVTVLVQHGEEKYTSDEQEFRLSVQPPNPMFLDPPAQVRRVVDGSQTALDPVSLKILIEFPDGHKRAVTGSQLFVDGKLASERSGPPFDLFEWNLAAADTGQRHMLQVKVTDGLGLTGSSIEIPVEVTIEKQGSALLVERIKMNPRRLVIGGAVGAAAMVLAAILWFGGRRGWMLPDRRKRRRMLKDPVTQPVKIQQDQPRALASVERPSWPHAAPARKPTAWLARLNEQNQPIVGQIIPLQRREITIGSNPHQASFVLNYPSIDGLHARIFQAKDGSYLVADAGSVAGTWINFVPVTGAGVKLEHGDLVHFGRAAFRFELAHPTHVRQPQVDQSRRAVMIQSEQTHLPVVALTHPGMTGKNNEDRYVVTAFRLGNPGARGTRNTSVPGPAGGVVGWNWRSPGRRSGRGNCGQRHQPAGRRKQRPG